jgi:hypothetical protein
VKDSFQVNVRPSNRLIWWTLAVVAVSWLHDLDHVRQVRDVEVGVSLIGLVGVIGNLVTLGLVIARHPLGPLAAVVLGFATAAGFVAVHMLPDWGPLSDGYPDLPVDGISWTIAIIPILVGLGLGVAGLRELRAGRSHPARVEAPAGPS